MDKKELQAYNRKLCIKAGLLITNENKIVIDDMVLDVAHPYQIFLKVYRDSNSPDTRLYAMQKVHDILWPYQIATNNHWQTRMFKAHCERHEQIVLAAGAATTKSATSAKIALINFLSNPKKNSIIVASVTLESLQTRIFGYVVKYATNCAILLPIKIVQGQSPKIVHKECKDKIHGIFAVAVKQGADENTISTIIGRHPDDNILVILDEATDMPAAITSAFPNLMQGVNWGQVIAIGNSKSFNDLHGAMATPSEGWDSIDPMLNFTWKTKHPRGICIYLNPYDSPAIVETDPARKEILSKVFLTAAKLREKEKELGIESIAFMRFVMGFWPGKSAEDIFISLDSIIEVAAAKEAHFSGMYDLKVIAGLDPALGANTKGCVLQLAVVGMDTTGKIVIDFRGKELTHYISVLPGHVNSPERQVADQVNNILSSVGCPLSLLAIDSTGLGRAIGELIRIVMGSQEQPIRILSSGYAKKELGVGLDPRVVTNSTYNTWADFREFIQNGHIKGLSEDVIFQLTNRRITFNRAGKPALEVKTDFINRIAMIDSSKAHSPHETDACMLCLYSAVVGLGFRLGQQIDLGPARGALPWNEKMMVFQRGYRFPEEVSEPLQVIPEASFGGSLEDAVWTPEDT